MSAVDTEENDGRSGNDTSNTWQAFHRKTKGSDVPGRFVTPGSDMSEAITATRIVNENQLNNILRLDAKLERFHVTQGQQTLLKKVNGMPAIARSNHAGRALPSRSAVWRRSASLGSLSTWESGIRLKLAPSCSASNAMAPVITLAGPRVIAIGSARRSLKTSAGRFTAYGPPIGSRAGRPRSRGCFAT